MKKEISLNGEWKLSYCDIGTGSVEFALKNSTIPCKVPSDVHVALTDAKIIKDPLTDKNSEDCKWMEKKEFWYVKEFNISAKELMDKSIITFYGVDTTCDVWLNGQNIASANNAFVEFKANITNGIIVGKNTLVVRVDEGLEAVKNKELGDRAKMWNNEQPYRVWMRKPQFVYSWDWTPWLVTIGIWKPVAITTYNTEILGDVYVESKVDSDYKNAVIKIETDSNLIVKAELYTDSRYDEYKKIADFDDTLSVKLENPELWWTNQYGIPYLYKVIVYLFDQKGELLDKREINHGIKTVDLIEEPRSDGGHTFTYTINGQKVFCKGADHVPSDCLIGRITDERERKTVRLAYECGMNMLRIWGGGVYASDAFMDECDKCGILVWHDFMFACGYYPEDEEFIDIIKLEATKAIKRLRNHAGLLGFAGNNEIHDMNYNQQSYLPGIPFFGKIIFEEVLPALVAKYCPDLIYRPSSPYGGGNYGLENEGDQHVWLYTHRNDYPYKYDVWRFTDGRYNFLSEFGIIGAMNFESAKKCISADKLYLDSPEWLHHSNNYIDFQVLNLICEHYFGDRKSWSLQEYILKSQAVQAECTRHIFDEMRTRKYECSGLLFWTLGDSYGVNNWSILDYWLEKRAVYYYLKRSMKPISVAIKGYDVQNTDGRKKYKEYFAGNPKPIEIWVTNDTLLDAEIIVEYKIVDFDGCLIKEGVKEYYSWENSSEAVISIDIKNLITNPDSTLLYVKLIRNGKIINDNKYLFAPFSCVKLNSAKIHIDKNISESETELVLRSDTFVWLTHLAISDEGEYSDNDFDLIPGEEKRIIVKGKYKLPEIFALNKKIEINNE